MYQSVLVHRSRDGLLNIYWWRNFNLGSIECLEYNMCTKHWGVSHLFCENDNELSVIIWKRYKVFRLHIVERKIDIDGILGAEVVINKNMVKTEYKISILLSS